MTQTLHKTEQLLEPKPVRRFSRWTPPADALDWRDWLERFQIEHGRSPRVLHVGNVANNGYNNAKVLVEAGFDCDALCYDYYHIMGCPEWEDGDFTGMVEDHFAPDWRQVDLRGFRRPHWFAQGPLFWAIAYLIARRDGRTRSAAVLWRILVFQQWLVTQRTRRWYRMLRSLCRRVQMLWSSSAGVRPGRTGVQTSSRSLGAGDAIAAGYRVSMRGARGVVRRARTFRNNFIHRVKRLPWPMNEACRISARLAYVPLQLLALAVLLACIPVAVPYHALRAAHRLAVQNKRREFAEPVQIEPPPRRMTVRRIARGLRRRGSLIAHPSLLRRQVLERLTGLNISRVETPEFEAAFQARAQTLIADFAERFPDRPDKLTLLDMLPYRSVLPLWTELFRRYDVIEGYATDPILPMLCGVGPCVAYEHGTIRDIPFEDSPTSRLCALAYARADAVVITNPDCRDAADRLGVRRVIPIPHLIDRKYYDTMIADAGELPPQIRPPYIFSPARHDWEVKGTSILINAFAQIADEYPDLQLVTPSWGGDIERSRALIAEFGLTDRVAMIEPLNIHNLIRVTRGARVLVDQFRFGVFGGIGPTALAVGTPLVTHLDHSKSDWCMEPPPYYEAWDVPSCVRALREALAADAGMLRASLRAWMRRNYWHGHVVDRHATLFAELINASRETTP